MKEAIGGTSLFLIVIVILSAFAMYISLSVNWSTAYKVKDEIIFYIEKNRGVNENTIRDIYNSQKEKYDALSFSEKVFGKVSGEIHKPNLESIRLQIDAFNKKISSLD
jgi:hypothetical protein